MIIAVTGHRLFKLASYDLDWIKQAIGEVLLDGKLTNGISYGLSGMASGVDLWFCQACLDLSSFVVKPRPLGRG